MPGVLTHIIRVTTEPYETVRGGRVVRGKTCDREVAGSTPARGCCVPTPTQRATLRVG